MSDRNAKTDSSGDLHEIKVLQAEIERLTELYAQATVERVQQDEEIENLEAQVEALQNRCARRGLSEEDSDALEAENERLQRVLKDVDRWLKVFIAAWDKSHDKKKPSEAPVALMEAIRQHSAVREALKASDE